MPVAIEFNYPPVDMTFFKRDSRRREIPKPLLERIGEGAKRLEDQVRKMEQDTGVRYPPAIVLPCALYDIDHRMIIDAHVTFGQRAKNLFLEVRFAAPTVAFADEKKLLSIAAHEFIHYVTHTISIWKYVRDHGTPEGMSVGEVPSEVKERGIRARDEYHTVTANDWLAGDALAAWQTVEQESFTVSEWANLIVREWIRKGYPTEDFKRGKATRWVGRVIQDSAVIDKAKRLDLIR